MAHGLFLYFFKQNKLIYSLTCKNKFPAFRCLSIDSLFSFLLVPPATNDPGTGVLSVGFIHVHFPTGANLIL